MGKLHLLFFNVIIAGLLSISSTYKTSENNWTHFRGSNLDGIADVEFCPVRWTSDSNIVWKTKIHGKGWSSPVVYNDQIWMTTAIENGKEMYAVCVDFNSGEILFDIQLFTPDSIYRKHDINSFATPTPCIEKDYVYTHFGKYGTACLNTNNGSIVWKRTDLNCLHIQGPGSSTIIYKDLLIVHLEGTDKQLITALNKSTGETVWETERPEEIYQALEPIGKKAYITPIIIDVNGRDMMISNGSAACIAYDPNTGQEIWRIIRGEDSTIAMPLFEDGTVFFHTGFVTDENKDRFAELMAVNPDGTGDIKATNMKWRIQTPILQLSTPLIKDGLLYNIDSKNNMMCLDASSGKTVWANRLKGKYNSSPVYAAGNIYFSSTNGKTTVIEEGPELNIIAENTLEGEIWTTPAIIKNSLIMRTSAYLYRIGK
jgi:outer membrane protein assembly factor BamB